MRRIIVMAWFVLCCGSALQAAVGLHTSTDWDLKPSSGYDALCLLNVLSGDPYYMKYYKTEYEHFYPLFTPNEQDAFLKLKKVVKDDNGGIVSASMALYLSATNGETLQDMIGAAHDSTDSTAMRSELQKTPYWSAEDWQLFEKVRPFLEAALLALRRVGFEKYWEENARPKVEDSITKIRDQLPKYDIVSSIEKKLGKPLSSNHITIYMLAYSEPHGIRITGTRFITHYSYPFKIVLHNAIHEMMQPPYDASSHSIKNALKRLGSDPLIRSKVQNHEKSFGYNDVPAYLEEDSVQALEEIVSEEFGMGRDARTYWKEQDGGMHVLAVAMYLGYKSVANGANPVPYSQWLVQAVEKRKLQGEELKRTIESYLAEVRQ